MFQMALQYGKHLLQKAFKFFVLRLGDQQLFDSPDHLLMVSYFIGNVFLIEFFALQLA